MGSQKGNVWSTDQLNFFQQNPLKAPTEWQANNQALVSSAKQAAPKTQADYAEQVVSASKKAPGVATADVVNWNVDPSQTVEGRMAGLLDSSNPLVQWSKNQALQDANARGLLNSSMGAEAGVLGAYKYALPIAQQDAQTYASAASQNSQLGTNTNQFNAGAKNTANNLQYTTNISALTDLANMANQKDMTEISSSASRGAAGASAMASMNNAQLAANTARERLDFDKSEAARLDKLERDRIAATAQNNLSYLDRQTQGALSSSVKQGYLSAVQSIGMTTQQQIQAIQNSNIPSDAKTGQISNLQTASNNTLSMINAAYTAIPEFKKDWSIALQGG